MTRCCSLLIVCGALGIGGAHAATYDFDFSGKVTAESVTDTSGGSPDFAAVLGRSFSSVFSLDNTSGTLLGSGSLTIDLSGHPGFFPGGAEQRGEATGTYLADLNPTLTRQADGSVSGSVTNIVGPTFNVLYDPTTSHATITADFALAGVSRADDSGSLFLTLTATSVSSGISAVPLPGSAPMFGAALLGLGALGWRKRMAGKATNG